MTYPISRTSHITSVAPPQWNFPHAVRLTGAVRLADMAPIRLRWLWPKRIPLGRVTLLASDPGLGKSLLALDIAARVSRGAPWPDESRRSAEPRSGSRVLIPALDSRLLTRVTLFGPPPHRRRRPRRHRPPPPRSTRRRLLQNRRHSRRPRPTRNQVRSTHSRRRKRARNWPRAAPSNSAATWPNYVTCSTPCPIAAW